MEQNILQKIKEIENFKRNIGNEEKGKYKKRGNAPFSGMYDRPEVSLEKNKS